MGRALGSDAGGHPRPGDVLLIVEVSDTSLEFDREVKLPIYAENGIPELWIVDIPEDVIRAYRQPAGRRYRKRRGFRRGQSLSPRAFPDLELEVDALLG